MTLSRLRLSCVIALHAILQGSSKVPQRSIQNKCRETSENFPFIPYLSSHMRLQLPFSFLMRVCMEAQSEVGLDPGIRGLVGDDRKRQNQMQINLHMR